MDGSLPPRAEDELESSPVISSSPSRVVRLGNSPRLQRQLLRVERVIATLPVEHGFAFTAEGRFLFHQTTGSPASVLLSVGQERLLKGAVFTHNHPNESSISEADLKVTMHFGLRQIRAVTRWARYWIDPPAAGWKRYRQRILSAMDEERPLVLSSLSRDIERGALTSHDAEYMYEHMLWRRLADRGLLSYRYDFWHLRAT